MLESPERQHCLEKEACLHTSPAKCQRKERWYCAVSLLYIHSLVSSVYKVKTSRVMFYLSEPTIKAHLGMSWSRGHKMASSSWPDLSQNSLLKALLEKCDFVVCGSLWFPRQRQTQESIDGWVDTGSQECGTFAFALVSYSRTSLPPAFVLPFSPSCC